MSTRQRSSLDLGERGAHSPSTDDEDYEHGAQWHEDDDEESLSEFSSIQLSGADGGEDSQLPPFNSAASTSAPATNFAQSPPPVVDSSNATSGAHGGSGGSGVGSSGGGSGEGAIAGRKRTLSNSNPDAPSAGVEKRAATKTCRVCGDKAYSYNFNVISCESCKAFFRRNANKEKEIRCPFNDNCDINQVSRRFCQRCRLKKCFEVGMKKEWIMSDEARQEKKQRIQTNRERRAYEQGGMPEPPAAAAALSGVALQQPSQLQQQQQPPLPTATAAAASIGAATPPIATTTTNNGLSPATAAMLNATNLLSPLESTANVAAPPPPPPQPQPPQPAPAVMLPLSNGIAPVAAALLPLPAALQPPLSQENAIAVISPSLHTLAATVQATPAPPTANNAAAIDAAAAAAAAAAAVNVSQQIAVVQAAQAIQQQANLAAAVQQQLAAALPAISAHDVAAVVAANTPPIVAAASPLANALLPPVISQSTAVFPLASAPLASIAAPLASVAAPLTQPLVELAPSASLGMPSNTMAPAAAAIASVAFANAPTAAASVSNEMIAVPKNVLINLVQENIENRAAQQAAPPIKCVCRCQCGRYPSTMLIVDRVMAELVEGRPPASQPPAPPAAAVSVQQSQPPPPQPPPTAAILSCVPAPLAAATTAVETVGDGALPAPLNAADRVALDELCTANAYWATPAELATAPIESPTDCALRRLIRFASRLAAFRSLTRPDQANLLKHSCASHFTIRAAMCMNNGGGGGGVGVQSATALSETVVQFYNSLREEYRSNVELMLLLAALALFDVTTPHILATTLVSQESARLKGILKRLLFTICGDAHQCSLEYADLLNKLHVLQSLNNSTIAPSLDGLADSLQNWSEAVEPLLLGGEMFEPRLHSSTIADTQVAM